MREDGEMMHPVKSGPEEAFAHCEHQRCHEKGSVMTGYGALVLQNTEPIDSEASLGPKPFVKRVDEMNDLVPKTDTASKSWF